MNPDYFFNLASLYAYRFATYALLNWADDAAILAFMFC